MKRELFYCDKCKEEKPKAEIEGVALGCGTNSTGRFSSRFNVYKELDLCKKCLAKLGYAKPLKDLSPEENKTLADKLYDIIAEIVMENQEQR